MGQSIPGELKMNWGAPHEHPVDMYFGAPLDFEDLRPKANMITTQKRAADRCLDAIKTLAETQRRDAAIRQGKDPNALPPIEKSSDAKRRERGTAKPAIRRANDEASAIAETSAGEEAPVASGERVNGAARTMTSDTATGSVS
jgi:hypothetical protein